MSIFKRTELSKVPAKRVGIPASMELSNTEPWDTFKAQLLVRIDKALQPKLLSFEDYNVTFYIRNSLPKPGLELQDLENYASLLQRASHLTSATPTIHIIIEEKAQAAHDNHVEKENEPVAEAATSDKITNKKNKKVIVYAFNHILYDTMMKA